MARIDLKTAVLLVNGAAASLLAAATLARHVPLELCPKSWRPALLRWRRSRRGSTIRAPTVRPSPFSEGLQPTDARFKAWPSLNDEALARAVGVTRRQRLEARPPLQQLFEGETLKARLSAALAERNAVDRKEFFETFEFFFHTRDCLRCSDESATLVEVAGGHGLLGILCAIFERQRFSRVVVADRKRPSSYAAVLAAAAQVVPWVTERIEYVEADFKQEPVALLPKGCAVACIHGCNSLTDEVLAAAVEAEVASLTVMPCCYAHSRASEEAPRALRKSLGVAFAADIQRTYTLEAAGFAVHWRHLPRAITPMNRILLARRGDKAGSQAICREIGT